MPEHTIKNRFPDGWDDQHVREVLDRYEHQTEDELLPEDQAAPEGRAQTMMAVPVELVPAVRALIAQHYSDRRAGEPPAV
jgi:hypothetical protein